MESTQIGSGDDSNGVKSPRSKSVDGPSTCELANNKTASSTDKMDCTPHIIIENDIKLKARIEECKNVINSLKFELNEEKSKLEKESKTVEKPLENESRFESPFRQICSTDTVAANFSFSCDMYRACIDSKLNCDENLIEYEKQLQKYQNTLNMAQNEKKNAIRKQMLAKAYRLKLLEIENQCNVELLRVKQSLQCLEPLKIIANKWKSHADSDVNSFDLIPRYLKLNETSGTEDNSIKNLDMNILIAGCDDYTKNEL